jgi:V8-like Glu-specific endopeptidase
MVLAVAAVLGGMQQSHASGDEAERPAGFTRVADIVQADHRLKGFVRSEGNPLLRISHPGATFLRVHFATVDIPDDVVVEMVNGDRSEAHRFTRADALRGAGENGYYAMSLGGDEITVTVSGGRRGAAYDLRVDKVDVGFEDMVHPSAVIGNDQRQRAVCLKNSDPDAYRRSLAVARVYGKGYVATAWRVGAGNRMLTNHHVIGNDQDPRDFEMWFGYEHTQCNGANTVASGTKVRGDQRLAGDPNRDFQLFTLDPAAFASGKVAQYGYLGLDVSALAAGTPVYIPQHGGGQPRQIANISDDGKQCTITAKAGTMGRYLCDTEGGSSGSPVIDRRTHRVRVLHNSATSGANQGNAIEHIWPYISAHFPNGGVPGGS